MKRTIGSRLFILSALLSIVLLSCSQNAVRVAAQSQQAQNQPYTVDYYYKVRWGFADEFIQLFKANHWPLLKKQVEMGRMLSVSAVRPRYHASEEGRWDYRVTIVFKNLAAAHDSSTEEALIKQMYPNQATFKKEEQRRFEILLAHWDVPLVPVPLD